MLSAKVRYSEPLAPWKQRVNQRGASRVAPKKTLFSSVENVLNGFKFVGSLILAVIFGMALYTITNKVVEYVNQPIVQVNISGNFGYINKQALQQTIEPYVETGFLDVDIEGLRHSLEKTPWVSHVEVERVWPNRLSVSINTRQPIARWGDDGLLNNVGQPLPVKDLTAYQTLPVLAGPDYAHEQVMQEYQIISQLLRPLDLSVVSLTLSDRGSWTVITNTGVEFVLGSGDVVSKIRRFNKAYDVSLKDKMANIARVDLRYNNALAVAWKDPSKELNTNKAANIVARQ